MLLRRFYDPVDGCIEIDGQDIRSYRLADYRRSLAMVLPESSIFQGTFDELMSHPGSFHRMYCCQMDEPGLHESEPPEAETSDSDQR